MNTIKAFIKRHQLLSYFALTFAISWGGFLLVGGPSLFAGTSWQTDPLFQFAILVMLAGPPRRGPPVNWPRRWKGWPSRVARPLAQVAGGRSLVRGGAPDH